MTAQRRLGTMLAAGGLLVVVACEQDGAVVVAPPTPPPTTQVDPAPAPTLETFEVSARELWAALAADDFETQYRYQDPGKLQGASLADFRAWAEENQPFITESYEIEDILSDGPLGWVHVTRSASMRSFPDMPARETRMWEKWRFLDGQWYPIPGDLDNQFPASPRLRDAAEEKRLAARFEESWIARRDRDFMAIYEMSDPRNRPPAPDVETLSSTDGPFVYLSKDVEWIEVIGDRGVVRVLFEYRLNDPSMSKLPNQISVLNDRWVRFEDAWYLDARGPAQ